METIGRQEHKPGTQWDKKECEEDRSPQRHAYRDKAANIQREERNREREGGGRETAEGGEGEGGVTKRRPRTERSENEMDKQGGKESSAFTECQAQEHMMYI